MDEMKKMEKETAIQSTDLEILGGIQSLRESLG